MPDKEPPLLNEETLLELGLINYNPEGKSIKSIAIKTPVKKDSLPTIKFDDPEIAKEFAELHQSFWDVFSGMGLLKGFEVDLILTKDIEFFNRPPIVPIHLRDAATERLHTFVEQGLFEFVTPGQPIKYSS